MRLARVVGYYFRRAGGFAHGAPMSPTEQNQEVVMQASAIRPRRPVVPPSYSLRAFEPRDAAAWVEIQAAADEYNVITPELFEAAFGSDEAMHRERIFMACDALGTP